MFKKSQRFSFRRRVPRNKIVSPFFILKYEASDEPKYAVVTSKAVSKKAVHRNKTKRMFIFELKNALPSTKTYTLVFFLRRPYTEYSKSAIITELQNVLAKLEVRN